MEISQQFWDDQKWGFKNHSDLLKKYKDLWVAIVNKKVVSAGKNLAKVEEEAKRKCKRKEVPVMFVECGAHMY